jgi:hypothetical protein
LEEDTQEVSSIGAHEESALPTDLSLSPSLGVRSPYTMAKHIDLPPDGSFER